MDGIMQKSSNVIDHIIFTCRQGDVTAVNNPSTTANDLDRISPNHINTISTG